MRHPIYRVIFFEVQAPYTLRVCFDDDMEQIIDFRAILEGELFWAPSGFILIQSSSDRSRGPYSGVAEWG